MTNKCCTSTRFRISNVKVSVHSVKLITINYPLNNSALIHDTANIKIVHFQNLAFSFFKKRSTGFSTPTVHITGLTCLCDASDLLNILAEFTDFEPCDCLYLKVGTISFSFSVEPGLKSKLIKMSSQFYNKYDFRVPTRFPAVIVKSLYGGASTSIFNSGCAISCGAKRLGEIYRYLDKFDQMVQDVNTMLKNED